MAYLGNSYEAQTAVVGIDYFNGNGSTTVFTLSRTPLSNYNVEVVVNNVQQNPSEAYGIAGNILTFTEAPSAGVSNIYVVYSSVISHATGVSPGSVGAVQLANPTGSGNPVLSNSPTLSGTVTVNGVVRAATLPFWENASSLTTNYTIPTGVNSMSIGPITVADGVTVTIPDGASWVIV